jgi:4-hydroxy-tetrahydrodipicolinate reductase
MTRIAPQLEELISHSIPVVSTCEELSYPWDCAPELSSRIDAAAKAKGVAIVGTGVNPGFLMDSLPTFLTAVCQEVEHIQVNRFQDAQHRRIPFQNKIGAGLTMEAFEKKKQTGTLRHVGLTESMQLIANRMGWVLDKTEDLIQPVIAEKTLRTGALTIPGGDAAGVNQIGRALENGRERIKLVFQAAVGESESYDEIVIKGNPNIHSRISGGVNGDVATCAIVINTIPQILRANPGLNTMADIPLSSYFQ